MSAKVRTLAAMRAPINSRPDSPTQRPRHIWGDGITVR
jgi:hypothetical protein